MQTVRPVKRNIFQELDLSGNKFCEIGGEWLGQGIAANEALEYLNLSWNHLRMKVRWDFSQ